MDRGKVRWFLHNILIDLAVRARFKGERIEGIRP
jgi:hypothetical protein